MPAATNVFETDVSLVALWRFAELPSTTSGMVFNRSQSTIYGAYNDLSISGGAGGIQLVDGPGASSPNSSGANSSGSFLEILHLPYAPSQSGNASGIDATSTQDMSFGAWILWGYNDNPQQQFFDFMGKFAQGNTFQSYIIRAVSGFSAPEWVWRVNVGITNGNSYLELM